MESLKGYLGRLATIGTGKTDSQKLDGLTLLELQGAQCSFHAGGDNVLRNDVPAVNYLII